MFTSGSDEPSNAKVKMQKSKLPFNIQKILLATFLAILLALLIGSSVLAADVRVAGTVASSIDGKAIERANVTITVTPPRPSQFFPKSTSTVTYGRFSFDIPETEFGGNDTLRIILRVVAPPPETPIATVTVTVQKTGTNNVPIITLNIAGNTNHTPQPSGSASSGTISYTSPDLSPIFRGRPYQTLGDYLTDLVKVAMVLSVVAATLVVVYAGFGYLNSGGSPEATAHAKEMIAGALIGIATVFLMSAFLVSLYDKDTLRNLVPAAEPAPAPPSASGNPTTADTARAQGAALAQRHRARIEGLIRENIPECQRIYNIIELQERNRGEIFQPSMRPGFLAECENIRTALQPAQPTR